MSRRSRRHGRNAKKATTTKAGRPSTKRKPSALARNSTKIQKKSTVTRGRGRWKQPPKKAKASEVKTTVVKKNMKQQNTSTEVKDCASIKEEEEILKETPDAQTKSSSENVTNSTSEVEQDPEKKSDDLETSHPRESPDEKRHDAENGLLQEDESNISGDDTLVVDEVSTVAEAEKNDSEINSQDQEIPSSCSPSNKDCESDVPLSSYVKQHSGGNQIHKCLVCSKVLSSASSLDRHMLVHSGERPFKCKLCDMAFTTNGNMHRHMRTHGELSDTSDVGKGVDLRKREAVKRKLSLDSTSSQDVSALQSEQEKLNCPICMKSLLCKYGLQSHMETHPNDPILCPQCGEVSSNYSVHLNHKCKNTEKKVENFKSACCGFQELNFMDFSTNKFSLVSKSFCEQNIKRPSSAFHVFECPECKKAFPCGRSLKMHMNVHNSSSGTSCTNCDCNFESPPFLQLHQLKHKAPEHCHCHDGADEIQILSQNQTSRAVKEDFLALFNLQTKESQLSLLKGLKMGRVKEGNFENMDYFVHGEIRSNNLNNSDSQNAVSTNNNVNNNDFADIQSIISLTSKAPLIKDVHSSPVAVRPMSPTAIIPSQQPESPQEADLANSSPETPSINSAVQPVTTDAVPEIVPVIVNNIYSCKVCNQKFRTINTLKRHSKMHLQRGSNYSCHLCSYISVDKSTLIRHLRTHNGERPFQCIICKYAFTTKANCERHVRKRHKKITKPEIRNCMQYNPNMALRMPDLSHSEISGSETVCKYCNVDFKFNRVLRHHLRSLHNSCNRKPFNCKICSFGFSTKNNCIRHVLKQHPNMKDKLRSVVIPNSSQKVSVKVSEPESDNTTDTNTTSSSNASRPFQPEQTEPLNLNCRVEEQPLNLSTEEPLPKTTSSEAVIAAESLVSLSETLPPQEEPLDLAIRPLDLSCKSQSLVTTNSHSRVAIQISIPENSCNNSDNLLDLSTTATTLSPKRNLYESPGGSITCPEINCVGTPNKEVCSTPPKTCLPKVAESPRPFGQKYRAFTCVYCSAGFTLKSNMERHIKRKHPEYARPTRSRNFIPAVIAHRAQKSNITMLSDKTRDALRHVLNTKVQHSVPTTGIYTRPTVSPICSASKEASYDNNYPINMEHLGSTCTTLSEATTDLSVRNSLQSNKGTLNLVAKSTSMCVDDNSTDLASVSSVICMANSQQFKQYFDKPTVEKKDECSKLESSVQQKDNSQDNSETNVSCPFCSRKFPWSSSLRRHILTHTGQKPYKCPRCALWFTTKSNCERHLIRKHGQKGDLIYRSVPDRPFKCNQCASSTFSTQGNLRKHYYLKHWTKSYLGMNTKVGDKRLFDEKEDSISNEKIAKTSISVAQSNEEHSYSQTEKKRPFACHFCIQKFNEVAHLSKHMQKHKHVIYMCYLCRKTFPTSEGCYSHFKTSHSLVYLQMAHTEVNGPTAVDEESKGNNSEDEDTPRKGDSSTAMACMICFQRIASLEDLQHHVKKHMQTVKANSDIPENSPSTSGSCSEAAKKIDVELTDKKGRPKNKVQNSLLYFFTPRGASSSPVSKNPEVRVDGSVQEEGSDLIQNLLGIHDSRIIDEMLVSADSAARLLGVKEV